MAAAAILLASFTCYRYAWRAIYMIAEKESDLILKERRQLSPRNVRTPRGS
jgi:hypothetical protein